MAKRQKLMLENQTGLHARPATEVVKIATKYKECKISLKVNDKVVDAKSPLMIMAAGIKTKAEIEIVCEGEGEEQALSEIVSAFENKFGEEK